MVNIKELLNKEETFEQKAQRVDEARAVVLTLKSRLKNAQYDLERSITAYNIAITRLEAEAASNTEVSRNG